MREGMMQSRTQDKKQFVPLSIRHCSVFVMDTYSIFDILEDCNSFVLCPYYSLM